MQVLVVDARPDVRAHLRTVLDEAGHESAGAPSLAEAERLLARRSIDVVVVTLAMQKGDREALARVAATRGTALLVALSLLVEDVVNEVTELARARSRAI